MEAAAAARAAARAAGLEVRCLEEVAELSAVADFLTAVWSRRPEDRPMAPELLRGLAVAGNYVAGAHRGDDLVAASVGFLGRDGAGHPHLHSHISGVVSGERGAGVGFALKLHQRAWALAREVATVVWTYDPLVRRNAYFNLTKLGGRLVEYRPHFYGPMDDGFNAGDETDRGVVEWRLCAGEVVAAAAGHPRHVDAGELLDTGAKIVLDIGTGGAPVIREARAAVLLARVPGDIVAVRRDDPALALEWRRALRETVGAAISDGAEATAVTRDGWYVVERP